MTRARGRTIDASGRVAAFETSIMDLADAGVSLPEIATTLDAPLAYVRRVEGYMRENSRERTFARETRLSSARLAAAIAATGRGYA